MNVTRRLLIALIFFISPLYAADEVLNIGTESFSPPFVMQGADHTLYGYDVDMMLTLCKIMNRTCKFQVMKFEKLIPGVTNKELDAAVSSITITAERAKLVNFTIPYLLSFSRFMTIKAADAQQPFNLQLLNDKKFGIEVGTIFAEQINSMGIQNPTIKQYDKLELLLEALSNKEVDFILIDNPTAAYWEANSGGAFTAVGPPYQFGYGMGIAVNKGNTLLLQALNKALLQYQASEDYKANYQRYLNQF